MKYRLVQKGIGPGDLLVCRDDGDILVPVLDILATKIVRGPGGQQGLAKDDDFARFVVEALNKFSDGGAENISRLVRPSIFCQEGDHANCPFTHPSGCGCRADVMHQS